MKFNGIIYSPTYEIDYGSIFGGAGSKNKMVWENFSNRNGIQSTILEQAQLCGEGDSQEFQYAIYNNKEYVAFGIYMYVSKLALLGIVNSKYEKRKRSTIETQASVYAFVGGMQIKCDRELLPVTTNVDFSKQAFYQIFNNEMFEIWEMPRADLLKAVALNPFEKMFEFEENKQSLSAQPDSMKLLNNILKKLNRKRSKIAFKNHICEEAAFTLLLNKLLHEEFNDEFLYVSGKYNKFSKECTIRKDMKTMIGMRSKKVNPFS